MAIKLGKPVGPDLNKIGAAIKNALAKKAESNVETGLEDSPLNTEEGKTDAANVVVANTLPNSGNEVLDAAAKDENTSFQGLIEAKNLAEETDKEEQKIKAETAQENIDVSNAISETAKNLYSASQGSLAGYETTATKEQVQKDVATSTAKDIYSSIELPTGLALEKLGVQDYFPTIGDNIITGSFSGRRLGSVTMFGAGGTVIPFGLMDARKKALVDAAQKKQAAMQKLQELPNTSEQFNTAFKQYAHGRISALSLKYNYDPVAFMRDPEAMGELYRLQTAAEAIINVDKQFDDIIKNRIGADGKPNVYIPEELLQEMYDFQAGKLDNAEDYFSGKKNVSELLKNAKTYASGTRMVDARIAELLKYPTELPVNLKKGVKIDEAALKEIADARKQVKGGSGYDSYLSVIQKFYDIDVDGIVDPWMNEAGYPPDDPARQWVKDYFRAQIPPDTITAKFDYQANKDYDYWKARGDWAREDEEKMAYWETVNQKSIDQNLKDRITQSNGKIESINKQIYAVRANGSLTAEEKRTKIVELRRQKGGVLADAYNEYSAVFGAGMKVEVDPNDGRIVYGKVKVNRETQKSTALVGNGKLSIYVADEVVAGGNRQYKDGKSSSLEEFKKHVRFDKNGNAIFDKGWVPVSRGSGAAATAFDKELKQILDNSAGGALNMSASEHSVTAGYTSKGNKYKVNTDNIDAYANSKDQTMIVNTSANPIIQTDQKDAKGQPIYAPSRVRLSFETDLNNFADRQVIEEMSSPVQTNESKFMGNE